MVGIPLLLDVDTGVDDAMAIALVTQLERHELIAMTTVAGNVPITSTTPNTLRVLEWLGIDVPVYRGMSAPLARPPVTAGYFHGEDGLGEWGIPEPTRTIESMTAPEAIVQLAREHAGRIVFAFVGPLTNLAVALRLEPDLPDLVDRLVIMGGAFFGPGNVTASAEFNIHVDPEAAAAVAVSSFDATWIGLDVTHKTVLDRAGWDALSEAMSASTVLVREVCRRSFEDRQLDRVHLHDPLAIAVVEQPDLVETISGEISVDVGFHASGRTRVSPACLGTGAAASSVDVEGFHRRFRHLLEG